LTPLLANTSLTAPIDEMRAGVRAKIGDVLDVLDRAAERFGDGDYAAPRVGDPAPDFTLPDAHGAAVALSELRGRGRVLLVFYLGSWCPYCHIQLKAFQAQLDELRAAGLDVVAVSPETPERSRSFAEGAELGFTVLSDAGNAVADRYGLRFTLDGEAREVHERVGVDLAAAGADDSWSLPAASTFLVERDGTVSYASVAGDWRRRVGPAEVLEAIRS